MLVCNGSVHTCRFGDTCIAVNVAVVCVKVCVSVIAFVCK